MASKEMARLSVKDDQRYLADELLLQIFSHFQLPSAAAIGPERYEVINVPKGTLTDNPVQVYTDNDSNIGACTHQREEWKAWLATLSSISKTSHRFYQLTIPLLYQIYPGQTLIKPNQFLRTINNNPDKAALVKELVIDAWDVHNTSKAISNAVQKFGLSYALVEELQKLAGTKWNDEAFVLLLLLNCTKIATLDVTCPSAMPLGSPTSMLLHQLHQLRPDTLARSNQDASKWQGTSAGIPLRKVRALHLHHAGNHYVRNMKGLEPLLRLATVQSVTAYRFWGKSAPLKNLKSVRELTLWRCSFDYSELLLNLRTCVELRSLDISFAGFTSTLGKLVAEKDPMDFKELGIIIRVKLTKLRKLRLDDRELDPPRPRRLGSLKDMPMLEELAVNEGCLGCYTVDGTAKSIGVLREYASMSNLKLSDVLPATLRSLTIFRANQWWHETNRGPRHGVYSSEEIKGLSYRFEAMSDKVMEFLRHDQHQLPDLKSIHIDTPAAFPRNVEQFGWKCQRIVGDAMVVRPGVVTDSMVTPKEKEGWKHTQDVVAAEASVVLRRAG